MEYSLQVFRKRHRLVRADVRAASVALRHPYPREQRRSHDPLQLTDELPLVALPRSHSKHCDVRSDMQQRTLLAKDVRTFKVPEGLPKISRSQETMPGAELCAVCP
jgi:hypothetical protein